MEERTQLTRPDRLTGDTHKIKALMADGKELSFYVTLNRTDEGVPYEIFVNVRDAQFWEHLTAVSVMISRLLQAGITAKTIADDLMQIHSPITAHRVRGRANQADSIYARIGEVLLK